MSRTVAADVVDHNVAELFRQRGAPCLCALEVIVAELHIENVGRQRAAGSHREGLMVHLAPEPAGNLHGFDLGLGAGGEDAADGFFDAAFDIVQQTHGSPPSLPAAGRFRSGNSSGVQFTTRWRARGKRSLLYPILLGGAVNDLNPQRPGACKSSAAGAGRCVEGRGSGAPRTLSAAQPETVRTGAGMPDW